MKKTKFLLACLSVAAVASTLGVASCGPKTQVDVALITDVGNVDDHSFNQSSYEGMVEFAEEAGLKHAYYRPANDTNDDRVAMIEKAIKDGADVLVLPGYLFEQAVYETQEKYPDVKFLLLDGEPHDASYANYKTTENTTNVLYKEDEVGYLAGYAAVMEGYKNIGFMGGMAVPAVIRYGHGYVAGANDAAKVLYEADSSYTLSVKYGYTGGFVANDTVYSNANSWYSSGVETIFACGGKLYQSVTKALDSNANATMIGVDTDQTYDHSRIITSAMKELHHTVYTTLKEFYDAAPEANGVKDLAAAKWDSSYAGKTRKLGAAEDMVGLAHGTSWKLKNYKESDYLALFAKVKAGEVKINVSSDEKEHPTVESYVTVDYNAYK